MIGSLEIQVFEILFGNDSLGRLNSLSEILNSFESPFGLLEDSGNQLENQ